MERREDLRHVLSSGREQEEDIVDGLVQDTEGEELHRNVENLLSQLQIDKSLPAVMVRSVISKFLFMTSLFINQQMTTVLKHSIY